MSQPSWEKDPTTRHEYRWWDGEQWTEHVGDNGVASLDPLTGAENLKPPKPRAAPPPPDSSSPASQDAATSVQAPELANRASRFGARLIDGIILVAFWLAVLFVLHLMDIRPIPFGDIIDSDTDDEFYDHLDDYFDSLAFMTIAAPIAAAAYEVGFTAVKGQTPGKMANGIRVVRADDLYQPEWGRPPSWGHSLARYALPFVMGIPMYFLILVGELLIALCYLSLTWDRERQGWHDKVARTLVVKKL